VAFEDFYTGTERIDVAIGYWIEIRTCLTQDDIATANKHLAKVRGVVDENGKMQTVVNPDVGAAQFDRVCASIVDWNLDERDGSIWRLEPDSAKRRNVKRLPDKVFQKLLRRVDELNNDTEDSDDRSDFRGETVWGAENGHPGAADSAEIPGGEETVGAPGYPGSAVG